MLVNRLVQIEMVNTQVAISAATAVALIYSMRTCEWMTFVALVIVPGVLYALLAEQTKATKLRGKTVLVTGSSSGLGLALAREAAKRLSGTPRAIELAAARMAAGRDDASYADKPVATLGTWRNFWASRLPYFVENNFPTVLVDFAVSILDAAGASDSVRSKADMTRLQEVLKFKDPSS